jgi:hypothetical protein
MNSYNSNNALEFNIKIWCIPHNRRGRKSIAISEQAIKPEIL